jgi:hypothetical protein
MRGNPVVEQALEELGGQELSPTYVIIPHQQLEVSPASQSSPVSGYHLHNMDEKSIRSQLPLFDINYCPKAEVEYVANI